MDYFFLNYAQKVGKSHNLMVLLVTLLNSNYTGVLSLLQGLFVASINTFNKYITLELFSIVILLLYVYIMYFQVLLVEISCVLNYVYVFVVMLLDHAIR